MDRALLSAVLVGLAIIEASAKLTEPRQSPVAIDIRGPIVVGFYPPPEDASDNATIEGLAHLRFAIEDIAECYGNQTATYRLEVTRLLILRDGQKVHQLAIPTDRAVGIILALPGREPRIVFAEAGPTSLSVSGPSAAAEYFNALGCRQDPTDHALRARDAKG